VIEEMSNNNPEDNNNNIGQSPTDGNKPGGEKTGTGLRSFLWVIMVLLIGIISGIILFLIVAPHIVELGEWPFGFPFTYTMGDLLTYIAEHIILSTVGIALLVSLVGVYARIYRRTRANFALGIFIVLLALLFAEIVNYPILLLMTIPGGVPISEFNSPLPTLADAFSIVAYTVFLYLSLE
jgi:hypothetical protein